MIQTIECNRSEARKILTTALMGKVFHVTSEKAFAKITKSQKIIPNKNCQFGNNWGSKNSSYFRNRGFVSVCDLKNNRDIEKINGAIDIYDFYSLPCNNGTTYLLVLEESLHSKLITWEAWKEEKSYRETVVPYLESGYPADISMDNISQIIKMVILDSHL